uniref:Centromere protein M n=1 Tax=Eptatretus burgeri TaxID=7764 RepID=A0A8C4QIC0_EPTBU
MDLLRPQSMSAQPNTSTILLVGADGLGQERLIEALHKVPVTFNLNVHVAHKLPLPEEGEKTRRRITLLVFLVDLTSLHSMIVVQDALKYVAPEFFLGKVFFLVTRDKPEKNWAVIPKSVVNLAATYHSPLIFSDLQNGGSVRIAAERLVRILKIAGGLIPGLSSTQLVCLCSPALPVTERLMPFSETAEEDPTVVPLVISAAILIFVFLLALVLPIVLYYSRRRACHHPEKPMALSPTSPTEKPDGAVTRLVVPTKTLSRSITRECQALQPENVGLGGSNVVVRAV